SPSPRSRSTRRSPPRSTGTSSDTLTDTDSSGCRCRTGGSLGSGRVGSGAWVLVGWVRVGPGRVGWALVGGLLVGRVLVVRVRVGVGWVRGGVGAVVVGRRVGVRLGSFLTGVSVRGGTVGGARLLGGGLVVDPASVGGRVEGGVVGVGGVVGRALAGGVLVGGDRATGGVGVPSGPDRSFQIRKDEPTAAAVTTASPAVTASFAPGMNTVRPRVVLGPATASTAGRMPRNGTASAARC